MACAGLCTLIDLFGPQVMAPALAERFNVGASEISFGVNAATLGMAVSGFLAACFADWLDRKRVIIGCLLALTALTILLAGSSSLWAFAALRAGQGLAMGAAFAVSVAFIAEEWPLGAAPTIMAAYVTGNIVGQAVGRVVAGALVEHAGWRQVFVAFAAINLVGALGIWKALPTGRAQRTALVSVENIAERLLAHLSDRRLQGAFAVGSIILATFATEFTYVNFLLVRAPFNMSSGATGLLYLVFCLAVISTPLAGPITQRIGHPGALALGALVSSVGAWLTLSSILALVIFGSALVACGLFFSQAVATAYTGYAARSYKATASGLYMAAYYAGGILG
jgi:predicted MFS family arabinose efflux permease